MNVANALTLEEVGVAPENAAQVIYDLRRENKRLVGWLIAIRRLPTTATVTEAIVIAGNAYQTKEQPPNG